MEHSDGNQIQVDYGFGIIIMILLLALTLRKPDAARFYVRLTCILKINNFDVKNLKGERSRHIVTAQHDLVKKISYIAVKERYVLQTSHFHSYDSYLITLLDEDRLKTLSFFSGLSHDSSLTKDAVQITERKPGIVTKSTCRLLSVENVGQSCDRLLNDEPVQRLGTKLSFSESFYAKNRLDKTLANKLPHAHFVYLSEKIRDSSLDQVKSIKKASMRKTYEYTVAYHTVQRLHMSGSSNDTHTASNSKPSSDRHNMQSTTGRGHPSGSATESSSKHRWQNSSSLTNGRGVMPLHSSRSKGPHTSSALNSTTDSKTIHKKTQVAPKKLAEGATSKSKTGNGNSVKKHANDSKRAPKMEKKISTTRPISATCQFRKVASPSSPHFLIKLIKEKAKDSDKVPTNHSSSKKKSVKRSKSPKRSSARIKRSVDSFRCLNKLLSPSLLMLSDYKGFQVPPRPDDTLVYRPNFSKSLQTIPEDRSVSLIGHKGVESDQMNGFQPQYWPFPNEYYRFMWPVLAQPVCQPSYGHEHVLQYPSRSLNPVPCRQQYVVPPESLASTSFMVNNHLGVCRCKETMETVKNEVAKQGKHNRVKKRSRKAKKK